MIMIKLEQIESTQATTRRRLAPVIDACSKMHRFGIDFKASLPQTALGLIGGVVAYRYFLKPMIHPDAKEHARQAASAKIGVHANTPTAAPATTASAPPLTINPLDSIDALEKLGRGKSVILIARGFSEKDVAAARVTFNAAVAGLRSHAPISSASKLQFYIVDDTSAQTPAVTLLTRLGITNEKPFVMILDRFIDTERKFLMKNAAIPSAHDIETFVEHFVGGRLKPAMLGQERPVNDRSPKCSQMFEIVTDSFEEIVLNPRTNVLLESYTRNCDACKAFAPRYRMLAQLCAQHMPELKLAAMDIQDNDKDMRYLPEKWTPSIRLFPAVEDAEGNRFSRSGDVSASQLEPGMVDKPSYLLDYDAASSSSSALSSSSSPAAAPGQHNPAGAVVESSSGKKVYLPTLPELLRFVEQHTDGRLKVPAVLVSAAADCESEAAMLEASYDQCLEYMRLWKAYDTLLDDIEQASSHPTAAAGAADAASGSPALSSTPAQRREVSKRMKSLIIDAYKFVIEEAGIGGLDGAMLRLDRIADWVEQKGIAKAIQAASAHYEESSSVASSGQNPSAHTPLQ